MPFNLEPQHDATYVLLSNLDVAVGRWDDVNKVRKLMKEFANLVNPGKSLLSSSKKLEIYGVYAKYP